MPTPTRDPYRLPANGIANTVNQHDLDRIDLGVAALKLDLSNSGWPARSPTDDRADRKPQVKLKCACGQGFPDETAWEYHADETGHRTRLPVDPDEASVLDYADPTGDLAAAQHAERLHRDLERIQDLHRDLEHTLRTLHAIVKPYVPTATADPKCCRNDCDEPAERNYNGTGFRGCQLVAGIWCAKPGAKIRCTRHRKADERAERLEAEARAEWEARHAGDAA